MPSYYYFTASSKTFKVGKRDNCLADFPLLDVLYDPRFNPMLLEDLNVDDVDLQLSSGNT